MAKTDKIVSDPCTAGQHVQTYHFHTWFANVQTYHFRTWFVAFAGTIGGLLLVLFLGSPSHHFKYSGQVIYHVEESPPGLFVKSKPCCKVECNS
uniref:Uncharacterized protein n=1 Tax=Arundo donax TaxID=35708 RepID=A0A0A9E0C4_ARUDO